MHWFTTAVVPEKVGSTITAFILVLVFVFLDEIASPSTFPCRSLMFSD